MYDRVRASRASHNAPSSLPSFLRLSGSAPPSALPDSVHLDLSDIPVFKAAKRVLSVFTGIQRGLDG